MLVTMRLRPIITHLMYFSHPCILKRNKLIASHNDCYRFMHLHAPLVPSIYFGFNFTLTYQCSTHKYVSVFTVVVYFKCSHLSFDENPRVESAEA